MRNSNNGSRSRAALLALICAAGAAAPAAWGTTFTWIGAAGSWGDPAQWTGSSTVPPSNVGGTSPEVFIGNNGSINLGGGSWGIAYAHIGHSGPNSPGTGLLHIDSGSITLTQNTYIGDGNAGTLIIDGGQYITTSGKNFYLGGGTVGTGSAYLEVDSGGTLTLNNKAGILPWTTNPGASTINMSGGLIDFLANDNADTILAGKFIFSGGSITNVANTTINELSGNGSITVKTNSSNSGVTVDQSIDTVFNGVISGAGGTSGGKFTKLGSGVLELGSSGSISLTSLATINGGTLRLGSNNSLAGGSSPPTISIGANGVLDLNGFAYTFKNVTGTGEIKLGNGGTLTINPGTISYDGAITGNGGLIKIASTGILTLTANNTYTGSTTISNGTLALVSSGTNNLSKSSSIALGSSTTGLDVSGVTSGFTLASSVSQSLSVRGTVTGNVTAPAGTTVTGNGTLSNNLTVSGGTIAPGNAGVGTIHLNGSLALNNAKLNIDVGATNADRMIVATTDGLGLSGNSVITLNATGALSPGTFTLIDYNGTPLTDTGKLTLASNTLNGFTVSLLYNSLHPTSIDLNVAATVTGSVWNFNGDGSYSDGTKWDGGVPNATDATANFSTHSGSITVSAINVTLDQNAILGTLNFDHASTSYTLGGTASLTMDVSSGQAAINVISGNHTIAAPIALNKDTTITVTPAGSTLAITGNLTATGKTITKAGAGAVQFENVRAGALITSGGTVMMREKTGTPNTASGSSIVGSLSIASGSAVDLANNAMIISYSSLGTLLSDTRQELSDGRLKTSLNSGGHALGYADNATLGRSMFGGQPVGASNVVIGYTFGGDANLDGTVNALDFNALANNYGATGGFWVQGDFNYDGSVNTLDFDSLASNFNRSLPAPAEPLAGLVPEPAAMWALLSTGLLFRIRRGSISQRC